MLGGENLKSIERELGNVINSPIVHSDTAVPAHFRETSSQENGIGILMLEMKL